jgi:hypothetical protein
MISIILALNIHILLGYIIIIPMNKMFKNQSLNFTRFPSTLVRVRVCVCVGVCRCACVCVRELEIERNKEGERKEKRDDIKKER